MITDQGALSVVSLKAESSIGFLETVFDCYRRGQLFAVVRDASVLSQLSAKTRELPFISERSHGWGKLEHTPNESNDPAQIVFSSGTEGRPKAILLSYRNLADVVTRLNGIMEVTEEIREYIGVPVTYSFGLGRARAVSAAGGRFFLPERFDPAEIADMLKAGQINAISAVPSLWRIVLSGSDPIASAARNVRWIEIGSQYMAATEKLALRELFPEATIVQHYGLTEASRSTFLKISTADATQLESVGAPTGDTQISIGQSEEIRIRGSHVALGLLEASGRIAPVAEPDGWLTTRDRGALRDGCLYYLGRLDDQINIAGIKIGAEDLEVRVSDLVPDARGRFATTAREDPLRGQRVLLGLERDVADLADVLTAAAQLVLERHGVASSGALDIEFIDTLPKTDTGKIQRSVLEEALDKERSHALTAETEFSELEGKALEIAKAWRRVLGNVPISGRQTFYEIGGDSLSGLQVGLTLEADGFEREVIRATLEGQTLEDIALMGSSEAEPSEPKTALNDRTRCAWAVSLTRGIVALSVVIGHWSEGFFGRLGLAEETERLFGVFYRMGTPGFAMIFGMSVGYFLVPIALGNPATLRKRSFHSFLLVFTGILFLAGTKIGITYLDGAPLNGLALGHAFYSVLAYYGVMLLSAPVWIPVVARLKAPVPTLAAASITLWITWLIAVEIVPNRQLTSAAELIRLMTVANYSVVKLASVSAAGVAVGIWFNSVSSVDRAGRQLAVAGSLGAAFCLLTMYQAYGGSAFTTRLGPMYVSPPGFAFYGFVCILLTGLFVLGLRTWASMNGLAKLCAKVLLVMGALALPIYVFHQLVLPGAAILEALGVSPGVGLGMTMGLFLAGMGYAGVRVYRLYFA